MTANGNGPVQLGEVLREAPPTIQRNHSELSDSQHWYAVDELRRQIGVRYTQCLLSNFALHGDADQQKAQKNAVDLLRGYCETVVDSVKNGRGIVLFGPVGTGKDHLMAAVMRAAAAERFKIQWTNGIDLFSRIRDGIGSNVNEHEVIRDYVRADVLAISDPVPPWGPLTQFQASVLFQIIDRRYRDRRPTLVTANFGDRKDASDRLGAQVLDRLKDGALVIPCDWGSYRKPA